MSQHDFNVDNQGFPALRGDVNAALVALVENSSGATEPSVKFANQWWADITAGLLKIRNQANNAWITVGKLGAVNLDLQFASGTLMLFQQAAAPVGWTKQTTHDSKALRVVGQGNFDGSGGTNSFKNIFGAGKSSANYTLTITDMPSHPHDIKFNSDGPIGGASQRYVSGGGSTQSGAALSKGGSGAHQHTLSLDLQYVDVIIASKD